MLATRLPCACEVAAEAGNPAVFVLAAVVVVVVVVVVVDKAANRRHRPKRSQSPTKLHITMMQVIIGLAWKPMLKPATGKFRRILRATAYLRPYLRCI